MSQAARKRARAPSLEDALRAAGYGHRKTRETISSGQREVFDLKTGAVVGSMTAHEGWEFLAAVDTRESGMAGRQSSFLPNADDAKAQE
jgi:hypothetical protein